MEENNQAGGLTSEADLATAMACRMLEAGLEARAKRFDEIRKNEDAYNGITGAALRGRNNVPFDCFVMGGFIDTLLSNVDEPVSIKYNPTREQDKMAADKVTAVFEREMAPDRANLNDKVLDAKFLASLAGRGFLKINVESLPHFSAGVSVCDHYDMVTEMKGGSNLDEHLYKFQMNIFRAKNDLQAGVDAGYYDKAQVRKVQNRYLQADFFKKAEEALNAKNLRYHSLGTDGNLTSLVGTQLYRFVEGVIKYNGKWKYIVFSYEAKTWVRFQPLEEVFEHAKFFPGRGPWVSFATHPHPFIFWSKAPADDVRPVGYTMKKVVNLTLDNLEKRNWDMTAYDPKMFTEPSQLLYRQDGLVRAQIRPGQQIEQGIFKFNTPDTTGITINLTEWLNNFIGQKTGITPDAQGAAQTDRVGILVTNLQQVSKRMMLANKRFRKMYADIGTIFDYGVYANLREDYAVKLIGIQGARWEEEVTRKDTEKDFTITVTSGLEEDEKNALVVEKREKGFVAIETNPALFGKVNSSWYLRERFKNMGYNDEQIRVALDAMNDGDEEVMAHAAEAIQDCLEGKDYLQMYRGATAGFIQKILDFAADKFPLVPDAEIAKLPRSEQKRYYNDMLKYDKLISYASAHVEIAKQNMIRKATSIITSGILGNPVAPAPGQGQGQQQTGMPQGQGANAVM
jgi:hypothetical protein